MEISRKAEEIVFEVPRCYSFSSFRISLLVDIRLIVLHHCEDIVKWKVSSNPTLVKWFLFLCAQFHTLADCLI